MASTFSNRKLRRDPAQLLSRKTGLSVAIAGTGSYVPPKVVHNSDLAQVGCDPEWIVQRTGIEERRFVEDGIATSDLALEAAKRCLESAGTTVDQIDLILCSTVTPDHPTPNTACVLQGKLGATCPAMDLSSACSGFIYGLITGAHFISGGFYKNVLVVGADIMSRLANPSDKKTFPLFGDAAGAVLLKPGGSSGGAMQGIQSFHLGADGTQGHHLVIPCGGSKVPITKENVAAEKQYLDMDGRPVFKWAVRQIIDSVKEVTQQARLNQSDIDQLILHQANIRIIDAASEGLTIPRDKIFVNLQKYGNTSAGSIPLAIDEARRQGKIQSGNKVLLCGFGAGLSWGACVLNW